MADHGKRAETAAVSPPVSPSPPSPRDASGTSRPSPSSSTAHYSAAEDEWATTADEPEARKSSVTDYPDVLHTASQPVMRDGVQVLTDRPRASDEPIAGRVSTEDRR